MLDPKPTPTVIPQSQSLFLLPSFSQPMLAETLTYLKNCDHKLLVHFLLFTKHRVRVLTEHCGCVVLVGQEVHMFTLHVEAAF